MAVEIANFIQAFAVVSATNPPVLVQSSGFESASYNGAGDYTLVLGQKASNPATEVQQGVLTQAITVPQAPTFGSIDANGDARLVVTDFTGAPADSGGLIFLVVCQFPTEG